MKKQNLKALPRKEPQKIACGVKLSHISMFDSAPVRNCEKFKFHRENKYYGEIKREHDVS